MSSPNTRFAASHRSGPSSIQFGTRKQITIGLKDGISANIMTMVPPAAEQYMRHACFEELTSVISTHSDTFPPSDLINVLTSELPIDTAAALQSANNICSPILSAPYDIATLEPRGFLTKDGKEVVMRNEFDGNRPRNLFYVTAECTINGKDIDNRIQQAPISFPFCLRLPQTTQAASSLTKELFQNDSNDDDVSVNHSTQDSAQTINELLQDLNNVATSQDQKQNQFNDILRTKLHSVLDTMSKQRTNTPTHTQVTLGQQTPKTSRLLATPGQMVTSYFGPLDFFDNPLTFRQVFGDKPTLLQVSSRSSKTSSTLSIEDSSTVAQNLQNYFQKCKLDVFIALCRSNYVGSQFNSDDTKAIQEITRKLQSFKMRYQKDRVWHTEHPNDLFSKYLQYVPSLPPEPARWNLILCMTYFNALTDDLQQRMTTDGFTMPTLINLLTKESHIQALQSVAEAASASYTNLTNEENRMKKLYQSLGGQSHRPSNSGRVMYNELSHASNTNGSLLAFNSGRSQAETTLQQYASSTNSNGSRPDRIEPSLIRLNDGLMYPYDPKDPSNISDFPVDKKCCLGCGSTDHFLFKNHCPFKDDPEYNKRFWKNLWLHKPHTKRDNHTRTTSSLPQTIAVQVPQASSTTQPSFVTPTKSPDNASVFSYQQSHTPSLRRSPDAESQVTWDASIIRQQDLQDREVSTFFLPPIVSFCFDSRRFCTHAIVYYSGNSIFRPFSTLC
jgi:predicted amino acid-binding ACT domain protein